MKYKISIIIPVLNEEEYIGKLLRHISAKSTKENIEEIIIVDGGSTDNSVKIISKFKNAILLSAPKGRARQLNYGARAAKGNILYFLHADSFPPINFDKKVIHEIHNNNTGSFKLKFEHPNHFLLKIASWLTQFNFKLFRGGDQSLFITKENFRLLNGFKEQYIVYEDIEFIERIYNKFNFTIIDDYVTTSERKFNKNGIWKLYYHFLIIHIKNSLKASPEELNQYYLKHIR